ncbi:MAG: hypothetical protein IJW94_00410 [Oscillospiraceae bacterium]|nr:hypothetical protein [Oscillospiraceae bacterium]
MSKCNHCGGCGKCSGCGGALELNQGELTLLQHMGQIPFQPIGAAREEEPVYLGDGELSKEEYTAVIACLEKKGLVDLEWGVMLKGFDGYGAYPIKGTMTLTKRGQQVLEILDIQGAQ